jgi:hypothetical protein
VRDVESATTSRHTERASVPESSVNVNESTEAVIHRGGHRGGSVGGAAGVGDGSGHASGRTGIGIAGSTGSLQTRALASSSRGGGDAHAKSARDSAGDSRQAALALWTEQRSEVAALSRALWTEQRSEVAALSVRESIPLSIDWKRQTLAYASCHDLCQILYPSTCIVDGR